MVTVMVLWRRYCDSECIAIYNDFKTAHFRQGDNATRRSSQAIALHKKDELPRSCCLASMRFIRRQYTPIARNIYAAICHQYLFISPWVRSTLQQNLKTWSGTAKRTNSQARAHVAAEFLHLHNRTSAPQCRKPGVPKSRSSIPSFHIPITSHRS
jgi:hypothetical protein